MKDQLNLIQHYKKNKWQRHGTEYSRKKKIKGKGENAHKGNRWHLTKVRKECMMEDQKIPNRIITSTCTIK